MRSSSISIVALCGSMGRNSNTSKALNLALEGAREAGAQTTLLELHDYQLPFAGQTYDYTPFPDVERLTSQIRAAHGVLWGTPEYHGSYTGVLKNALDLMGFEEFQGKMIGLVGVAGGSIGAINALSHLRTVGRQLHAWVLPQQVSIARVSQAFDTEGKALDADVEKRLKEIGRDVARFSRLHQIADDDFIKLWERAVENPGGEV
jgi:NAD(P)H-dependent FMN reductase